MLRGKSPSLLSLAGGILVTSTVNYLDLYVNLHLIRTPQQLMSTILTYYHAVREKVILERFSWETSVPANIITR